MDKEKEILNVKDVEESDNSVILDVPDYVYISASGKTYQPKATKQATVKIKLEEAEEKGYKPSLAYKKFVKQVYEEYIKNQQEQ